MRYFCLLGRFVRFFKLAKDEAKGKIRGSHFGTYKHYTPQFHQRRTIMGSDSDSSDDRKRKHSVSSSSLESSSSSSSSSEERRARKKEKKRRKKDKKRRKKEKKEKKRKRRREEEEEEEREETARAAALAKVAQEREAAERLIASAASAAKDAASAKSKSMAPMTPEDYQKLQSTIREVVDPVDGRVRLVRGTGEILERIVSRDEHLSINAQATRGDGSWYARQMNSKQRR